MRALFTIILLCCAGILVHAQSPQSIKYQAVARDGDGLPIPDQSITVRISINEGTASGPEAYAETHSVATNGLGIFTLNIGTGTPSGDAFNTIDWTSGSKFINLGIDPNGGSSFIPMGNSELLSVPYAFYADRSGATDQQDGDTSSTNELITSASFVGDSIVIQEGGSDYYIDLSELRRAPDLDDNNELNQDLYIVGDTLYIQDEGGTLKVSLEAIVDNNDADAQNELNTDFRLSGSNLIIEDAGGDLVVDLSSFIDDDADAQNEINLSLDLNGDSLAITDASGTLKVSLASLIDDADADPLNEMNESLSLSNDSLILIDGAGELNVDLSSLIHDGDTTHWKTVANGIKYSKNNVAIGPFDTLAAQFYINADTTMDRHSLFIKNQGSETYEYYANWMELQDNTGENTVLRLNNQSNSAELNQGLLSTVGDANFNYGVRGRIINNTESTTSVAIDGRSESYADAVNNFGVRGYGESEGVRAYGGYFSAAGAADINAGVAAFVESSADSNLNVGVYGESFYGYGVWGYNDGDGTDDAGVYGFAQGNNNMGVLGENYAASQDANGVRGVAGDGIGVNGVSDNHIGVHGQGHFGVMGYSDKATEAVGVMGIGEGTDRNVAVQAANLGTGNYNLGLLSYIEPTSADTNIVIAAYNNGNGNRNLAMDIASTGDGSFENIGLTSYVTGASDYNTGLESFINSTNTSTQINQNFLAYLEGDWEFNYGVSSTSISSGGSSYGVRGVGNGSAERVNGLFGYANGTGNQTMGIRGFAEGQSENVFGASGVSRGTGIRNYGVAGYAQGGGTLAFGVAGFDQTSNDNDTTRVAGVYGFSQRSSGVEGVSNGPALRGRANGVLGITYDTAGNGVVGDARGANHADAWGVLGQASLGDATVGISDSANGLVGIGATGIYATGDDYAGYFEGDVEITGSIAKAAGTFKIDHPLDPANKFLVHSFVESPDMMNIYNGNVITDVTGLATVELPSYFQALNMEFRYQLTVMGQFAQAIVLQEIAGNQFVIQTDKPAVKVSWQVTGVRQDPYAVANRVEVEVDKVGDQVGKYLHPTLHGLTPDLGIGNTVFTGQQKVDAVKQIPLNNKGLLPLDPSMQNIEDVKEEINTTNQYNTKKVQAASSVPNAAKATTSISKPKSDKTSIEEKVQKRNAQIDAIKSSNSEQTPSTSKSNK